MACFVYYDKAEDLMCFTSLYDTSDFPKISLTILWKKTKQKLNIHVILKLFPYTCGAADVFIKMLNLYEL